jgi:hypothetical protein
MVVISQTSTSMWHTGLSGGAPDSVWCPGLPGGEVAALGKRWGDVAKFTGLSGEPSAPALKAPATNSSLSGKTKAPRLKFTGLSGGAPDCPVSQRHSRPTVGYAISGRRVVRANGRLGTLDCPMCTGQCPVCQRDQRANGRLRQKRKEIGHRTGNVHVRWCTGLSGAPPYIRQELPSNWFSNGS